MDGPLPDKAEWRISVTYGKLVKSRQGARETGVFMDTIGLAAPHLAGVTMADDMACI